MMTWSNRNHCCQSLLVSLNFFLFFFLLILNFRVSIAADSGTSYIPIDNFTIDCGSLADGRDINGRFWGADNNPKFFPLEPNNMKSVSISTSELPRTTADQVPYITVRLSLYELNYRFHVRPGPKFIRLYFYPILYQGFHPSKAFFSVKTGPYTLLKNFSASLHSQGKELLIKEYCVVVDESRILNLTFTPSAEIPEAYAFINGIEIVSMPAYLYYTDPSKTGIKFVGQAQVYFIGSNSTALEMIYRINVGGNPIPAGQDSGMYRTWSWDNDYLTAAQPSAPPVKMNTSLVFKDIQAYSAPADLYRTARSMGTNSTNNTSLTWEFPVDSGFVYFVRLHFREFQVEITRQGQRVFEIFVANLTAEAHADVVGWSGGPGIPTYKDYAVALGMKGNEKRQNLSIAMYPARFRTNLSTSNAILSGIEIFKLNNYYNLAGPNPDQVLNQQISPPMPSQSGKSKNDKETVNIAVVVAVSGSLAVFLLLCFFILRLNVGYVYRLSFCWKTTELTNTYSLAILSNTCRHFSLGEIKAATNNFDSSFIIGGGGFGNVYKGFIDNRSNAVAIKRLNPDSRQGAHEFKTEIEMLSQLRHHNLVSLIGYCIHKKEMILVYDYMVHGALRDHLYNTNNPPLTWEQRLRICIGAAYGLHYLHRGPNHTIIHRDVKSTNILLGEKWVAKVSDFGLSKMNNLSKTHISTAVKGSFGYLDPEYYRLLRLTEKSDVYSFGVVLFEVVSARAPIDPTLDPMRINLVEWAQHRYNNGTLDQLIDPLLQGKINRDSLKEFVQVAINCLASEGIKRPSMSEVVCGLELALQLQLQESDQTLDVNQVNDHSTITDYNVLFTTGSGSMNVGR